MNSDEWVELEHLLRIHPSLNDEQVKRFDHLMDKTGGLYRHPFNFDGKCLCDFCQGIGDWGEEDEEE